MPIYMELPEVDIDKIASDACVFFNVSWNWYDSLIRLLRPYHILIYTYLDIDKITLIKCMCFDCFSELVRFFL